MWRENMTLMVGLDITKWAAYVGSGSAREEN
jgi:hypothetical protein